MSFDYGTVNVDASEPVIDVQLLDVNPYSRPGTTIDEIHGIVIHYTANPGSTAQENRDYFNGLKDSHETEYIKEGIRVDKKRMPGSIYQAAGTN